MGTDDGCTEACDDIKCNETAQHEWNWTKLAYRFNALNVFINLTLNFVSIPGHSSSFSIRAADHCSLVEDFS
jgi:hypothetical protein